MKVLEKIDSLTEKLSSDRDITEEEASYIRGMFSNRALRTILSVHSDECNSDLLISLIKWYEVVEKSIKAGRKGNFLDTIFLRLYKVNSYSLSEILQACLADASLDNIDKAKKMHLSKEYAEEIFKKNTVKLEKNMIEVPGTRPYLQNTYKFHFSFHGEVRRVGLYPFIKDYAPVPIEKDRRFLAVFYDGIFSDDDDRYFANKETLRQLFIGRALYQSKINSIVISTPDTEEDEYTFLYVPKETIPLVKSWLEIPIEEIVKRMMSSPKIKTVEVDGLLEIMNSDEENATYGIPQEIGIMGARTIMKLTSIKSDKERVRNEHIDEDLLEMVR